MQMNRPAKIWFGMLTVVALILLSQCSPYAGTSMLHFLFDGVPLADSSLANKGELGDLPTDSSLYADGGALSTLPDHYIHYPYEERECASCHDEQSLGSMVESQPGLCYMCHEDLAEQYQYLHGPVAGGYCTSCHNPHDSENEHLLRMTGDALCFYCHEAESVLKNEMHEGLEGMFCTDCHNPHGGEDKYIFQ